MLLSGPSVDYSIIAKSDIVIITEPIDIEMIWYYYYNKNDLYMKLQQQL